VFWLSWPPPWGVTLESPAAQAETVSVTRTLDGTSGANWSSTSDTLTGDTTVDLGFYTE
jgi:hypothetical protein